MKTLPKEPLNLVVAGVGGQGNVRLASLVGSALMKKGYFVSVADTLGAAQRGGAVTSHVRISKETMYGPFVLEGRADIILGMEPVETLRMLVKFGNPEVATITNPRPIYPVDVLSGKAQYPDLAKAIRIIKKLSAKWWMINATDEALKLGNPIFTNVILIGALIGSGLVPLDNNVMGQVLLEAFPNEFDTNMMLLNRGIELVSLK
jgi:indolepyruvate ferredoxin oxidoreductase beta subunit